MKKKTCTLLLLALFCLLPRPAMAQVPNMTVYDGALENGWQNWSWATVNFSNTSPVYSDSDSIAVMVGAWQALYLHETAFDSSSYVDLTFWINGGATGGQKLQVQATLNGSPQTAVPIGPLAANSWQQVTIPLSELSVADQTDMDGFWIEDSTGGSQPAFYVDDITITSSDVPPPPATVSVDVGANVHPISPDIYGVAYATTSQLTDLNTPVNRLGGNDMTTYNWQLNASNKGSDWYFESIGDASATAGERGDTFISNTKAAGSQAMVTIPMIGWVANLGANRAYLDSFSVAKYGPQQATDPYWPDAGNGVNTSGQDITGNNPADANTSANPSYQAGWINHLVSTWGTAANGGLPYYIMDNEPSIWYATHRDVHPIGAKMSEVYNDIVANAGQVKAADPSALVVGPEEWGWSGYFYSGYDQQYGNANGWSNLPDRAAHNNMDYLPWLLQQMQQYQATTGKRLLDVFSVHFYPQGGEYSNDTSAATELLRNRSTRQLWDPNYVSESWIGAPVNLIPLLQGWVNTYYPGTKTAITEYNWGAEDSMNGATTQADIEGIFGRQGLNLATRWGVPDPAGATYQAMKMYRNYDGNHSVFGDTSVSDTVPNPDGLSSFAALRSSDGALTVMVINKTLSGANTPVTIDLANFSAGSQAAVWQLSSASATITQLASLPVSGNTISLSAPAQSVTLLVVPKAVTAPPDIPVTTASISGVPAGPATITLSATDPVYATSSLTTYYTLDNGSQLSYSGPITVSAYGNHTVSYYSTNPAGGTEATHSQAFAINYPMLAITSLNPSSVVAGSAGFTLTINGSGFTPASTVSFGGQALSPASVTSTAITVSVPASAVAAAGSVSVSVTNPAPGGGAAGATFTVSAAPVLPTLASLTLSPASLTGGAKSTAKVTLTHAAPTGGAVVAIKSGNTSVATVPSATITVPAGATSATFTVSTLRIKTNASVVISAIYGATKTATLTVKR